MNSLYEPHFDILLLEDSAEDRALYRRHLDAVSGVEFDISEAESVQQAKDITKNRGYDCYVIDYNLPDASGMDFIRHILDQNSESQNAAIVIVTGQGSEEIAAEAFKLGAHEYLTKKSVADGFFGRPLLGAIERAKLTAQIKDFQERLERSNRDLSEFTHTAAHDLKSPLRRIASYCEILQEEAAQRLSDDDKGILERMTVNAKRMQNLIDNLLSYSLIQYDEEEKKETNLKALTEDVVSEFDPVLRDLGAKITVKNMPVVQAYQVRLRQLLSNLISNALKYKGDSPPRILIEATEDDKQVTVCVEDNGQGIPKDLQEEIFKDFKRLHASEDIEGTGLGLSICKKIVACHDGRIWVESTPGAGSSFYFTIGKN